MKVKQPCVLQVVTGLGVGGAERVVVELSDLLPSMGYATVVVALNSDRRLLEQYPCTKTTFHFLDMTPGIRSFFRASYALRSIMRRERVSIVHAHMFHALVVTLVARGLDFNCKIIFTSHNSKGFSRTRRFLIWLSKSVRSADIIFERDQHVTLNAALTKVIPNGVPVGVARQIGNQELRQDYRIFLFLGRLETAKNPVTLVRQFAKMHHIESELWLAGDGYLREEVENEIVMLGLNGRVKLLGVCQNVPQILDQVDCLVMPSLWEGLPMAILEAGAVGLPVVATRVGAIPEILADDCGYLVEPDQIHAVLDSIVENYGEAIRRGERLMEKVTNHYSTGVMSRAHVGLYNLVLLGAGDNEF